MVCYAVLGAGGYTGRACVETLLRRGCHVRAVVRDPNRANLRFASDPALAQRAQQLLEVVQGDVTDPKSLRTALEQCSGIIFAATSSGWTQLKSPWRTARTTSPREGVKNAADVALELGGVERFVLISSIMVTPARRFHPARMLLNTLARWGLMDWKFQGEQHLRLSGVPYTIVRPGWITGTHSGKSRLVAEQGDKATRGGSTSCYDIAAVCCAALTDPDARNVTLELFSRPQHQGGAGAPLAEQLRDVFHGLVPD